MWAKWLAAILLGLPLAVALVGICTLAWPGPLQVHALPWLLMFFPVWIGCMSLPFVFASGLRAWLWMGGATLLAFAVLQALKAAGGAAVTS